MTSKKQNASSKEQFILAIVVAIIGLCGTVIAAFVGYLGIKYQIEKPISATQTAQFIATSPPIPNATLTVRESEDTSFGQVELSDGEFCLHGYCKCVYGWSDEEIDNPPYWILRIQNSNNSLPFSKRFVLLSSEPVVIRSIKVQLVKYIPSPTSGSFFKDSAGCSNVGGWITPNLELKNITTVHSLKKF
jgi:hypothetical protein